MRTNIEIDDRLMADAMAATGQTTKRATVEQALRQAILTHERQQAVQDMFGLGWVGDLDAMREGRLLGEAPSNPDR